MDDEKDTVNYQGVVDVEEENRFNEWSVPFTQKRVVIVGGGPVGLATALTLSQPPHSHEVIVLEQSSSSTNSVARYDPTRAYLYNINRRGLAWIEHCQPSFLTDLQKASVRNRGLGSLVRVPADPQQPIPVPSDVQLPVTSGANVTLSSLESYWIPRHTMVQILQLRCHQQHEKWQDNSCRGGSIQILSGKKLVNITTTATGLSSDSPLTVWCDDGTSYPAQLVVGADGIDSAVRELLGTPVSSVKRQDGKEGEWLHARHRQFRVRRYRSPSTGLNIKCLQFPPAFPLPQPDGTLLKTQPETLYSIRSIHTGLRSYISFGLLPVKDPTMVRAANVHTRWNHQIWSLKNGNQAKEWFQVAFPRLNFDLLVNDTEWERFLQAKGTTYPYCQYSPGSVVFDPRDKGAGVVLVGDACHAFPPDIGQGINAGFQDVLALDRALKGQDIYTGEPLAKASKTKWWRRPSAGPPSNLGQALQHYQDNRRWEHAALIRLARFGAPYQYSQPWIRDRIGKFIWSLNIMLRLLLNKLSGGLIPPAAVLLAQQPQLSYRQVMQRADITASSLTLAFWAGILFLFRKRLLSLLAG